MSDDNETDSEFNGQRFTFIKNTLTTEVLQAYIAKLQPYKLFRPEATQLLGDEIWWKSSFKEEAVVLSLEDWNKNKKDRVWPNPSRHVLEMVANIRKAYLLDAKPKQTLDEMDKAFETSSERKEDLVLYGLHTYGRYYGLTIQKEPTEKMSPSDSPTEASSHAEWKRLYCHSKSCTNKEENTEKMEQKDGSDAATHKRRPLTTNWEWDTKTIEAGTLQTAKDWDDVLQCGIKSWSDWRNSASELIPPLEGPKDRLLSFREFTSVPLEAVALYHFNYVCSGGVLHYSTFNEDGSVVVRNPLAEGQLLKKQKTS